jgi:hypothetical protein
MNFPLYNFFHLWHDELNKNVQQPGSISILMAERQCHRTSGEVEIIITSLATLPCFDFISVPQPSAHCL